MKILFQPLSEFSIVSQTGERLAVPAGEKKFLSVGLEAAAGEKKEYVLDAEISAGADLTVAVFVRGAGEILINRTLRVLGAGAKVVLKCSGTMSGTGRISASDDVRVTAEGCDVDVRTKLVLSDSAFSEARSRVVLERSARGSRAFARIDHLLLSDHARAFSIPELEVETDDVTCGHAASCSSLPPASLQYLEGRGLDRASAERLLVHGFLSI